MPEPVEEKAPFVDLYKLLELSPDADEKKIRGQILDVYREAQRNLDHRNFRNRFYYQELYEVHLPQAKHVLLNQARRAQYDKDLGKHKQGEIVEAQPLDTEESIEEFMKGAVAVAPRPAKPRAVTTGTSALSPKKEASKPGPRKTLPSRALLQQSEVDQRRDYKRRELIRQELVATGLRWGMTSGVAFILVASIFLFILYKVFENPAEAFGMSSTVFNIITFVLLLGVGSFVSREALRYARRRVIGKLSQMPYEELLRRCGHGIAVRIFG